MVPAASCPAQAWVASGRARMESSWTWSSNCPLPPSPRAPRTWPRGLGQDRPSSKGPGGAGLTSESTSPHLEPRSGCWDRSESVRRPAARPDGSGCQERQWLHGVPTRWRGGPWPARRHAGGAARVRGARAAARVRWRRSRTPRGARRRGRCSPTCTRPPWRWATGAPAGRRRRPSSSSSSAAARSAEPSPWPRGCATACVSCAPSA